MELLILLAAFAVAGYLIGLSRFGREADRATEHAAEISGSWAERIGTAWNSTFRRRSLDEEFRRWISSQPADRFPESERLYLQGLSSAELHDFVKSLDEFSSGLGFSLKKLLQGGMDGDPRLRTVFVEAISVYSSAYRKARGAQREAESNPMPDAKAAEAAKAAESTGDGKSPAEKAVSRRKEAENNHAAEPAATD